VAGRGNRRWGARPTSPRPSPPRGRRGTIRAGFAPCRRCARICRAERACALPPEAEGEASVGRIASSDAGKIKNAGRKEAEARCDRCRNTALAGRARDVERAPLPPPAPDRASHRGLRLPRGQARNRARWRTACRAARAGCRSDERSRAPRLPGDPFLERDVIDNLPGGARTNPARAEQRSKVTSFTRRERENWSCWCCGR
jgi:hypothetical protein